MSKKPHIISVVLLSPGRLHPDSISKKLDSPFECEINKHYISIGSSSTDDISFDWGQEISENHCCIVYDHECSVYYLIDNDAPCGTYLNNERLVPRQDYRLFDADEIRLGDVLSGGVLLRFVDGPPSKAQHQITEGIDVSF